MDASVWWIILIVIALIAGPLAAIRGAAYLKPKLPPGVKPLPPDDEDDEDQDDPKPPAKPR